MAVAGLKEAMSQDNQYIGEVDYIDLLPYNQIPHFTKPDYGRRGDLKTTWAKPTVRTNKNGEIKHSWLAGRKVSNLRGDFDIKNVYQIAGWWYLNGRRPPFLVYARSTDCQVFTPDNCDELSDDFLAEKVTEISVFHQVTERTLQKATDVEDLFSTLYPIDFNHNFWKEEVPEIIELAKKTWSIE